MLCPVSVFNYSLLINFKTKLGVHSGLKQNGHKKNFGVHSEVIERSFLPRSFLARLLYLNRGLAKLVQEEAPAIMILFEPKGRRPEDEGNGFYIQTKKNMCWMWRRESLSALRDNTFLL
ncbi:hypothetical protein Rs2_31221 [Raphanus sativus]|nr:hypothetical protein Rs2_31221 [Raphanus sativus]